jgi:fermentation-respiration switch protein FrsA (DUF1100 family)
MLTSTDGCALHGWWHPCERGEGAILICHGNAGNVSHRGDDLLRWAREVNVSALVFDYPGFGKSEGSPTEAGCYAAAEAAYAWLMDRGFSPERVLIYGESLGGGVAVELARRKEHRALVLVNTFTSMPDVAERLYPFLPIQPLMRNRFASLAKIGELKRPIFQAHGTADSLIPYAFAERLHAAAPEPKEFLSMPGNDHADPLSADFIPRLRAFLNATAPLAPQVR